MTFGFRAGLRDCRARWRATRARSSFTTQCTWARTDKGSGRGPAHSPRAAYRSNQFIERLLVQNFIAIPSPVFRREAVIQSGGLDEALWFSADWDLWLRLGALGPVRFIGETLSAFRVHPASQTAARKLQPNEWEEQLTTVLARHLENWPVTGRLRTSVERVARASIAVNSALSAASRGEPVRPAAVLLQLLALGPWGWHRVPEGFSNRAACPIARQGTTARQNRTPTALKFDTRTSSSRVPLALGTSAKLRDLPFRRKLEPS